jgi:hypothetical protein
MHISVLGIDLGKNSCSVVRLDASGRVILRRRPQRQGVVKLAAGLPSCTMAMEACCGPEATGEVAVLDGEDRTFADITTVRLRELATTGGMN